MKRAIILGSCILVWLTVVECSYSQSSLRIYGYGDLIFRDVFEREFPNTATIDEPKTFSLLRTHFLVSATPINRWRMFVNLRFKNAADLTEGRLKGEIELFEGWFQYTHSRAFNVRGGRFLSPFGYFNEIHVASPAYNTVVLPLMFEDDFIRTAGGTIIPPNSNLQVFGDHRRGHFKIGYSLYIGNGTAPDEIAQANRDNLNFDVNDNKGTGFRLALDPTDNLGGGLSLYSEKGVFNVVPQMQLRADTDGDGVPDTPIVPVPLPQEVEEERKTVGLDFRFTPGDFELRGEFIKSFIDITGADYDKTFYFVNLNYTFEERFTPYFELNVYRDPTHFVFRSELRRFTLGAAFRPNGFVTLKAEFHNHTFGDVDEGEDFAQFVTRQPASNFKSFQMFWTGVSFFFN
ncbi:MAG: hypothetical protein E2O79_05725 [Caldithrix sp.]|nr:MAG: hypothetical protein E2O79_05725 [Caldithrix sp.]